MCYNKDNKQDEEVINMRNPLIITIGREYGSGGREIGELVAKTLGIAYYDKKLITLAAQKSGLSDEFIANNEQRVRSGFMQNLAASAAYSSGFFSSQYLPLSESIFISEAQVIRDIAAKESAVIVGRCADYILRDRKDCLHVFICSDMASRARRIVERYGQTQKAPEKRLAEKDQKRKVYYKNYTGRVWGQAQNYDICLNSGALGVDTCADMIVQLCK